jgi:hypothetical protein
MPAVLKKVRVLALLPLSALFGAAVFYFAFAKTWRESLEDQCMTEAGGRVRQAELLRQGKVDEVIQLKEALLLYDLKAIGTHFRNHPGALHWMEHIEKYFVSNRILLPPEYVELLDEARRELKYSDQVFYK